MKISLASPAVQAAICVSLAWFMFFSHAFDFILPMDAGLLGQMADRLLHGQMAHIDFEDTYTGGLNYLHAGFFLLLGEHVTSLRWCLLAFALPWLVTLHWMARRVLPPLEASMFFLAVAAWCLPVYMESMPSWYNMFFATWAAAALWKHSETGHWKWLLLAGAGGSLSGLMKVTGILILPAAAMYVFGRLTLGIGAKQNEQPGSPAAAWGMRIFLTASLIGVSLTPLWIIAATPTGPNIVNFALPLAAWGAALLIVEWRRPLPPGGPRLWQLLQEGGWITLGAAVPLALFAAPYLAHHDGLWRLCEGVFILPARRIAVGLVAPLPGLRTMGFGLPLLAALLLAWWRPSFLRTWATPIGAGLCLSLLLAAPAWVPDIHLSIREALSALGPIAAAIGAIWLATSRPLPDDGRAARLLAIIPIAALTNLLRYPFSTFIYFAYAAPLLVLAAVSVQASFHRGAEGRGNAIWRILLGAAILFPILWMHGQSPAGILRAVSWSRSDAVPMDIPRAGAALNVLPRHAATYQDIRRIIIRKTPEGVPIYAQPDCPEIAFFSERDSCSRSFFPVIGREPFPPSADALRAELREKDVRVVVINLTPMLCPAFPDETMAALRVDYPNSARVGNFVLLWRDK